MIKWRAGENIQISSIPRRAALAHAIAEKASTPLVGDPRFDQTNSLLGFVGLYLGVILFIVAFGYGYHMVRAVQRSLRSAIIE